MLSYIPVIISITLITLYAATVKQAHTSSDVADVLAGNMYRHHVAALASVAGSPPSAGTVSGIDVTPFRNMGDWRSDVISDSGVTVLATWAEAYSTGGTAVPPDFDARHYRRAAVSLSARVRTTSYPSHAGIYDYDASGPGGSVGSFETGSLVIPVQDGSPILLSVLTD